MPADTYGLVTVIVLFCEAPERVASIAAYYFIKASRNEERWASACKLAVAHGPVRCYNFGGWLAVFGLVYGAPIVEYKHGLPF